MGKHTDAELRALAAMETSLDSSNRSTEELEVVGQEQSRHILAEWIDLEKRIASRTDHQPRPRSWTRYLWLLWAIPTMLVCAAGVATVIYLLAAAQ